MKVYVWEDPYQVTYGSSLIIAVASSIEEAKKVVKEQKTFSQWTHKKTWPIELGEPTRILEAPCCEWHEWSE